jgi:LCP family protein required for cell wall assembly
MGYVSWSFWDASSRVFVAEGPEPTPRPTVAPGQSSTPSVTPTDEYNVVPVATPDSADSRVNILLTGVDSAESRSHALTDTLMVVSVDPASGDVAMISFPRDIADFELWNGGTYHGKINSFMTYARLHPDEYPDGPLPSLVKELGYLLGVPIHYYAAVDLAGFRKMIDLAGGVTIDNPTSINDQYYDWLDGTYGFGLSAGKHKLDGRTALAYVRSRQSAGDNDFNRARRQQQVLLALRRQLTKADAILRIPELTQAAGDTIRTNFPTDRVGEFVEIAQRMNEDTLVRKVLGPPYAVRPTSGVSDYRLRFDMDRLARLSIDLFGDESRYAKATN